MEINASDDRAAEAFKQRIRDATQMRGVLNMDGRPNCLILDEIDGATKAAVNVLVTMAKVRRGDGADGSKVEVSATDGCAPRFSHAACIECSEHYHEHCS